MLLLGDFEAKLGIEDVCKLHFNEHAKQKNYTQYTKHTSNAAVHGAVIVQSGASQEWHLYFLTDEKVWFF